MFNTKEQTVIIFNVDSGLTYSECINTKWFYIIFKYPLILTEWIYYTNEEMKDSIIRQCLKGYLKEYTFVEACRNWWNKYDEEERATIMGMPNFNKDIFKEITGIEIE